MYCQSFMKINLAKFNPLKECNIKIVKKTQALSTEKTTLSKNTHKPTNNTLTCCLNSSNLSDCQE